MELEQKVEELQQKITLLEEENQKINAELSKAKEPQETDELTFLGGIENDY